MPSRRPEPRQLRIVHIRPISRTAKGNCYLESDTDDGVVAFWGMSGNMSNIELIQRQSSPFSVQCSCIPSKWPKHVLWVPQSSPISVIAESLDTRHKEPAAVSVDDLTCWRRAVIQILNQLEGHHGEQSGLVSRIGQLSRIGVIPREIAAFMRVITELRNVMEYESKLLSSSESEAARNAWNSISDWARSRGLHLTE